MFKKESEEAEARRKEIEAKINNAVQNKTENQLSKDKGSTGPSIDIKDEEQRKDSKIHKDKEYEQPQGQW